MDLAALFGCISSAPPEELARRNLFVEGPTSLDPERLHPAMAERMYSGHAPFGFPEGCPRKGRLNIGALDDAWRRDSMDCLEDYLARASRVKALRLVNLHPAPRRWREGGGTEQPQPAGEYALMIEGLRKLAAIAAKLNLILTVENNRAYWEAIPREMRFLDADRTVVREYFGTTAGEWIQIWRDTARENVFLCLDSSHATTTVHRYDDLEERRKALWAYLSEPRALKHIHWNDNDPWNVDGREDRHLPVGSSGLGREFNAAVLRFPGASRLLEHFTDLPTLDRELAYIGSLDA